MSNSDEDVLSAASADPVDKARDYLIRKRKVIKFAAAGSAPPVPPKPVPDGKTIAEKYLSIVFPNGYEEEEKPLYPPDTPLCSLCGCPDKDVVRPDGTIEYHIASRAHQLKIPHSFPPSSIDRKRKGLAVLQAHGWDPDSRLGLGANGEGIRNPIALKENNRRDGIGIATKAEKASEPPKPAPKLNAKQLRIQEQKNKKLADDLRDEFFRDSAVLSYLGDLERVESQPSKPGKGLKRKRI